MKIVCLALLLVAALQLQLSGHLADNPLIGKSFQVTDAGDKTAGLKNLVVQFTDKLLKIRNCDNPMASYTVGDNTISVSQTWNATFTYCGSENTIFKGLWNKATNFNINGKVVKFSDNTGKVLFTLKQTN